MKVGNGSHRTNQDAACRPIVVSTDLRVRAELISILCERLPVSDTCTNDEQYTSSSVLELTRKHRANLCLLDVEGPESVVRGIIRELAERNVMVVVLHRGDDPALILRCFRSGASDFLSPPYDSNSVWSVLDQLARKRGREETNVLGSVCMVVPAKPSLGGTTLAINLARRAQSQGRKSVLLLDLDPVHADVGFLLRIHGEYTFLDAFRNWERMDGELWRNLLITSGGIDVLISPEEPHPIEFSAPAASEFVKLLRRNHSLTFADCPGLWTPWYAEFGAAADEILLVTTNEVTALRAARRSMDVLQSAGVEPGKIKLVVNRYNPGGRVPVQSMEAALNTPVFHTLPNDSDEVQRMALEGKAVPSASRLGQALDELSARLGHRSPVIKPGRNWGRLLLRHPK